MKFILITVDHNVPLSHGYNINNQKFLPGGPGGCASPLAGGGKNH
jgi:hypothetical protein